MCGQAQQLQQGRHPPHRANGVHKHQRPTRMLRQDVVQHFVARCITALQAGLLYLAQTVRPVMAWKWATQQGWHGLDHGRGDGCLMEWYEVQWLAAHKSLDASSHGMGDTHRQDGKKQSQETGKDQQAMCHGWKVGQCMVVVKSDGPSWARQQPSGFDEGVS